MWQVIKSASDRQHRMAAEYLVYPFCEVKKKQGNSELSASTCHIYGLYHHYVLDVDNKLIKRMDKTNINDVMHNEVLNLSDDGDRWEGDIYRDEPFGWGVFYDSDGIRVYEGFRIGNKPMYYGRSYYPDIQKIEYEGGICEGKRWGKGTLYDRNGMVVYKGEWINDEYLETKLVLDKANQLLHNHIEELIVSDDCCNEKEWEVLNVSLFPCITLLKIGNECFKCVKSVKCIGLELLKKMEIGNGCFRDPDNKHKNERPSFVLKDCPLIEELSIGTNSFNDYKICEISNVPSITTIKMGYARNDDSNSFYSCRTLELKGLRTKND